VVIKIHLPLHGAAPIASVAAAGRQRATAAPLRRARRDFSVMTYQNHAGIAR